MERPSDGSFSSDVTSSMVTAFQALSRSKRVTLLDPGKLDLKLCVVAHVTLEDHHEEAVASFAAVVEERPEIMECYALSGSFDYMLKIRARDVESYEAFMTRYLMRNPHVRTVVSSFVLRELKSSTELPIQ